MDLDCTRLVVLSLEVEDCQRFVNSSPLPLQSFTHSDCELPVHQATRPSESLNGMEPPPPIPPLMLQEQHLQQQQQSQAFGEPQHQEQQPQPFATPDQVGVAGPWSAKDLPRSGRVAGVWRSLPAVLFKARPRVHGADSD